MAMSPEDTTSAADSEQSLWLRLAQGDIAARQQLVVHYMGLVKGIAAKIYGTAGAGYVEFADLVQLGVVALLQSITRFDPAQGVPFANFASKRIRGAMLTGLESNSEYHAQYAFRRRVRCERAQSLSPAHRRGSAAPTDVFLEMVEIALGLAVGYLLEGSPMYLHEAEAASAQAAYRETGEVHALAETMRRMVSDLPDPDRKVIQFHYFDGIMLSDVAALLGLSGARVSQIHAKALRNLRLKRGAASELVLNA